MIKVVALGHFVMKNLYFKLVDIPIAKFNFLSFTELRYLTLRNYFLSKTINFLYNM